MLKRDGHRCHRDECSIPHPLKLGSSYYRDRVSEVVAMVGQYIHFLSVFLLVFFLSYSYRLSFFFSSSSSKNVLQQTPRLILMQTTNTRTALGLIVYIYISNLIQQGRSFSGVIR